MRGRAAYLTVKGEERIIFHKPLIHAPLVKRSWPFSIGQMHDVELWIADASKKKLKPNKRFCRRGISLAIDSFLEGCSPDDEVRVDVG